jgi:DNA ligase-1
MGNLYNIALLFNKLANTSGKIAKTKLLEENKDSLLVTEILKFVFNFTITTGISDRKLNKKFRDRNVTKTFQNIIELMEYIKINNTGTDEVIQNIQYFIDMNVTSITERRFIEEVVTKNMKIGMTEDSINKVYGYKLCPKFSCQLAERYDKKEKLIVDGETQFAITPKLDGLRVVAFVHGNSQSVQLFSRKGILLEGFTELEDEILSNARGGGNVVLDGELLIKNVNSLPSDELFKESLKVCRKKGEKKDVEFHIFDVLSIDEFERGISDAGYTARAIARHFFTNESELIKIVRPLYTGTDKSQIAKWAQWASDNQLEGVMINLDKPYETKRTTSLLKVKKFETMDLRCIGMEEGSGKLSGTLGAIIVSYKGNEVKVGSGFSDTDRALFWNAPVEIIDQIVEVQYFEESSNQNGGLSLRFPVFKCVRIDKTEADN